MPEPQPAELEAEPQPESQPGAATRAATLAARVKAAEARLKAAAAAQKILQYEGAVELRAELAALKQRALWRRAESMGVDEDRLDAVEDDITATIELCVEKAAAGNAAAVARACRQHYVPDIEEAPEMDPPDNPELLQPEPAAQSSAAASRVARVVALTADSAETGVCYVDPATASDWERFKESEFCPHNFVNLPAQAQAELWKKFCAQL